MTTGAQRDVAATVGTLTNPPVEEDDIRTEAASDSPGLRGAERDPGGVAKGAQVRVPAQLAGGDGVKRDPGAPGGVALDAVPAANPQDINRNAAPRELLEHGNRRQDMAAGAAAGDDEPQRPVGGPAQ